MVEPGAFDRIAQDRIVPVVIPGEPIQMEGLVEALFLGGLGTIEITLRSETAIDAISIAAKQNNLIVGAGTVLSVEQAENAVGAGARFLVSPGFDPAVVGWAKRNDVPIIPGIATVSEAMRAIGSGLHFVKLFPAEQLGGAKTVQAMGAVLPDLKIMPTGGVTLKNLTDYLSVPAVGAVGGTWIAPADDIVNGHFAKITERAKAAVALSLSL
ncbi:MAG: bifunctional 4-hydroxy-2-oxoglutarate aldolase/2-dehydro-3-deoxy-phosphogluconate aldolase [Parasphingorhabdus sp.]